MEIVKKSETELSVVEQVMTSDDPDWILSIRLKSQSSADLGGNPGDFVLGKDKVIGPNFKAFVGPWRLCAMRFKNAALDLKSYNRTAQSTYAIDEQSGRFVHNYPDMSLDFQEIYHKKEPDRGMECSNMNGFEILFYIPEIGKWGIYFIAKSAKKETNVAEDCIKYFGKCLAIGSKRGASKRYNYHVPTAMLSTDDVVWPADFEEIFSKFLDTPIEATEEGVER